MGENCFCHFNGYKVKDAESRNKITVLERVIKGIRRKVNAHSGAISVLKDEQEDYIRMNSCRIAEVPDPANYVDIWCSNGIKRRRIRVFLATTSIECYEVVRIGGYGVTRNNLYSSKTENKTLMGVWIDGERKETTECLLDGNLTFTNLVIAYSVKENGYTINTCLTVNPNGMKIYESIPEDLDGEYPLVKTTVSSQYVTPVYTKTNTHSIFTMGTSLFIETVEDLGNTVMKTFDFSGGL